MNKTFVGGSYFSLINVTEILRFFLRLIASVFAKQQRLISVNSCENLYRVK
jgi:hypothetical protein